MSRNSLRTFFRGALCAAATLSLFSACLAGERSVRFRAGSVVSAESSSAKPEIMDETQFEPYKDLRNLAWAEVVVKLDKGRTLSASDYVLVVNGTECKCVAIAEDDKVYSLRDWAFNKTNMFGSYRLLFPAQGQVSEGELRFKLLASPLPDVPLKFRNMGSAPFTESSKLPVEGALGLSVQDVKNAKKPASSGDAAKK